MTVAPEPYHTACLEVMKRAILSCRMWGWSDDVDAAHLADLMDAIHNIPYLVQNWEFCDIEFLRSFFEEYEKKWLDKGGLTLCQIFDDHMAANENSP